MADFPSTEGLIIEIESDASNAVEELEKLTAKLEAFKTVISSSRPLATFSKNFKSLNDAISASTVIDSNKIASIGQFADSVSKLNGISVNASIGNQLQKLGEVGATINESQVNNIFNMSQALINLSALEGFKFPTGLVKGLEKVASFASTIEGRDFTKLRELTEIITNMYTVSGESAKNINALTSSMKNLTTATKSANTHGKQFNTVLANIRTRTMAYFVLLRRVISVVQTGMETYGDYIETLNLFTVSMEDAGEEAYAFAEKCQYLLGIDLTQWMKAQGVFMSLGKGFGVATDRAALMSQQLTQLAYDISSFYNISVEDAIQKVQSGFSGQIKPMRQLGYDLSVAKLEAIALSLGIDKSVKSMTQAEKSQLRYIAMLTQVKDVQGDLARTLDSPVNQMRILQAQVQQMYRSLGQLLLPILNNLLPYLMAIIKVLKVIIDEVASLFGYVLPTVSNKSIGEGLSLDVEDLTDDFEDATGAAEKLKNTLASFDEINLIGSKSGSDSGLGSGLSAINDAFDFTLPTYDFLGDATENRAQKIADALLTKIRPALEVIKDVIRFIRDNIDIIMALIETIAAVTIGAKLINTLMTAEELTRGIGTTLKGLALVTIGIQLSYLGGKDIAQGDIGVGLIKSIGGAIAAGMGGWVIAGVPGLAIGVTLSVFFSVKGYFDEKDAQHIEEVISNFFYFDDARISVEQFTEVWETFVSKFANSELDTAISELDASKNSLDQVAVSIMTLKSNFEQGVVDADDYVRNMGALFGDLEEAVSLHIDSIKELIITALHGEVGLWMQAMGVDIEAYEQAVLDANTAMTKSVQDTVDEMGRLNTLFENGGISVELYNQAMEGYFQKLNTLGVKFDELIPIGENFITLWSMEGVNFNNLQEMIDTVKKVDEEFGAAEAEITERRNALISSMEAYKPYMPEGLADQAIAAAESYYNRQYDLLVDGYEKAMQDIENSAAMNWDNNFNTYGFKDAMDIIGGGMIELDDTIATVMSKRNIVRYESSYQDIMAVMREYMNTQEEVGRVTSINGGAMWYETSNTLNKQEERWHRYNKRFGEISKEMGGAYKSWSDYVIGLSGKSSKSISDYTDGVEDASKKQINVYNDMLGHANNTLGKIPVTLQTMARDSMNVLLNNQTPMYQNSLQLINKVGTAFYDKREDAKNKLRDVLVRSNDMMGSNEIRQLYYIKSTALMDQVKTGISDKAGSVKDEVRKMLDKARDIDTESFKSKGKDLRNKLLGGFTDTSGLGDKVTSIKKFMQDSFDGSSFYSTGKGIGNYLSDGLRDTEGQVEGAVKDVTKRMAKPFGQFGDDLYQYMNDMGSGIKEIWNSLEISTGKATFAKGRVAQWKLRGFASGGFPDSGEIFMANENGVAEYIGSMNGKQAVANNAEIIKGVSDGVYKALKNSGLVGDVKIIANKSGEVVFAPSEEAGRVISQSVTKYNSTGGRY